MKEQSDQDAKNEYNLLTEELLLLGCSTENHPEYVKVPEQPFSKNPLENIYGGFEFTRDYVQKHCFQTGCGLYVTERNCINDMGYMGVTWCFENDNVLIKCPYHKTGCEQNHPLLAELEPAFVFCSCHMTDRYAYENSVERILEGQEEEMRFLYQQYKKEHAGRICQNHMYYDSKEKKWDFRYDPVKCVGRCSSSYCPVRSRPLLEEKGNVFYDVRISTKRKDGTFFDGQLLVTILKGKKFLNHPVSMDICEAIAATAKETIYSREWWNGYSMRKIYDPDLEIEIQNIRAGRRAGRNAEQDLAEQKAGIAVIHEADLNKQKKEQKMKQKQERLERLERKIIRQGYDGLCETERKLADKKLGTENIALLESKRKCIPVDEQLSLDAWMEV